MAVPAAADNDGDPAAFAGRRLDCGGQSAADTQSSAWDRPRKTGDVMTTHALTLIVGIVIGCLAGSSYAKAARGWFDYRSTKAQVPILLAAAWKLTRQAAFVVLLATVLVALGAYVATAGQ